ncbi:DDIT4L (predicted) [Pycnogonum litorale]
MSSVERVVYKIHDIIQPNLTLKERAVKKDLSTKFHHCSSLADLTSMVHEQVADMPGCHQLAERLESCLRDAKHSCLECNEVLIPLDLISNVTSDIQRMSSNEPCGLRGCVLFIHLEEDKKTSQRIGKVKLDNDTVETFELHLKLKKERNGWKALKHMLPNFLQKFGKDSSIVISPLYSISKRKLFRSWS